MLSTLATVFTTIVVKRSGTILVKYTGPENPLNNVLNNRAHVETPPPGVVP